MGGQNIKYTILVYYYDQHVLLCILKKKSSNMGYLFLIALWPLKWTIIIIQLK